MKTVSRLLIVLMIFVMIFSAQVKPVKADELPLELTPAEELAKKEILADGEVDLEMQTIRGLAIVEMWKDLAFKEIPFFKIKNAVIDGNIDAEGISLPFMVQFIHCTFKGNINLESAQTKTFRIDNDYKLDAPDPKSFDEIKAPSMVYGFIRMGRMIVDGDLALYGSKFVGPVTLFDAHINNNLYARNSRFHDGKWPDNASKYPFELWTIYVGEKTEFKGSVFYGDVMAENAEFNEDVDFSNTTFERPVNFTNFRVGNYANFQQATFAMEANFQKMKIGELIEFQNARFEGDANFESSVVDRDADFTGAAFDSYANFNYFTSTRFMDLDWVAFNKLDFRYANIGWPYFEASKFYGPVDFEGVETPNDFDFTNAKYTKEDEPFTVYNTKVGGRVLFKGFFAPAGLKLADNHFDSLNITGVDGGLIELDGTKINGDLYLKDVTVDKLFARDLVVNNSTTFLGLKVMEHLDLSNTSLGSFKLGLEPFWPAPEENNTRYRLNLRGTIYTDVSFVKLEVDNIEYLEFKNDRAVFLTDMVAASVYSPQAYRTLGTFLTEKGQSEVAAEMEYDRKVRLHSDLPPWSPSWLLSWFRWGFSGYGKYPWLALLWSLVLIFISTLVFWFQGELPDGLKHTDGSKILGPEKFLYCFLYSFFLFFSFVVLEFAKDWEPKETRTSFKAYKQFHKMLGLIIAPTAGLVFGGLIK